MGRSNCARLAVHFGPAAACLLQDDDSGGHIPWIEAELPKGVDPAASDVAKVDGGRSGPPHAVVNIASW